MIFAFIGNTDNDGTFRSLLGSDCLVYLDGRLSLRNMRLQVEETIKKRRKICSADSYEIRKGTIRQSSLIYTQSFLRGV